MRLGLDSYSYHRYFGELREGEEDPGIRWSHEEFMGRAGELGLDGVSLETCYLPMDDPALPERLAAQAAEHGLELVLAWGHPGGLHMGTSAAARRRMLDALPIAAAAGCRLVRIVVGTFTHWGLEPEAPILDRVVPLVAEGCERAADLGLELAIETHCDLTLDALCELLDRVGRPDLGVVLDTANLVRIGEDLREGTRRLAPFARMLHVKDLLLARRRLRQPRRLVAVLRAGGGGPGPGRRPRRVARRALRRPGVRGDRGRCRTGRTRMTWWPASVAWLREAPPRNGLSPRRRHSWEALPGRKV